jgi:hypothetical protein
MNDLQSEIELALLVALSLGWISGVLTAIVFRWGRQ